MTLEGLEEIKNDVGTLIKQKKRLNRLGLFESLADTESVKFSLEFNKNSFEFNTKAVRIKQMLTDIKADLLSKIGALEEKLKTI